MTFRRFFGTILAVVFGLSTMFLPAQAYAAGEVDLGNIAHYNGFIFGNFSASSADVEGALAIGGTSSFGGRYDVGGAHEDRYQPTVQIGTYKNPNNYPTLLLGGETSVVSVEGGAFNVDGGPLIIAERGRQSYEVGDQFHAAKGLYYETDATIDSFFAKARSQINSLVQVLEKANEHPDSFVDFDDCRPTWYDPSLSAITNPDFNVFEADNLVNTGNAKILVVNFTNSGSLTIKGPQLCESYNDVDFIIFNFPNVTHAIFETESLFVNDYQIGTMPKDAETIPGGYDMINSYAQRVVWNFPNATDIDTLKVDVIGSVLAPNATVTTNGGSINGLLVAENFHPVGGSELHAFTMRDTVFAWENPDAEDPTGSVKLVKYDGEETDHRLYGAVFRLQAYEAGVWVDYAPAPTHTTDSNGEINVSGLPFGSYQFVETDPPDGFVLNSGPIQFKINEETLAAGFELLRVPNNRVVAEPDPIDLELTKTDGSTGLPGAKFTFYEMRGNTPYELYDVTSMADGRILLPSLTAGEYRLVEVNPPYGYDEIEAWRVVDITVAPDETGQLTATVANADGVVQPPYEIPNSYTPDPVRTRVEIVKLADQDGRTALQGAVFDLHLFNEETDVYESLFTGLVTDENGQIILEDLPFGYYMLEETSAPEGYEMNTTDENAAGYYRSYFQLTEDNDQEGMVYFLQHDVYNLGDVPEEPEPDPDGSLTVRKIDADTQEHLSGAVFRLLRVVTGGTELVEQFTVDEGGGYTVSGLPLGEYILEEVSAPEGYVIQQESIGIMLTETLPDQTKTVENAPEGPDEPEEPDTTSSSSGSSSSLSSTSSSILSSSSSSSNSSGSSSSRSSSASSSSSSRAGSSSVVSSSSTPSGRLASSTSTASGGGTGGRTQARAGTGTSSTTSQIANGGTGSSTSSYGTGSSSEAPARNGANVPRTGDSGALPWIGAGLLALGTIGLLLYSKRRGYHMFDK